MARIGTNASPIACRGRAAMMEMLRGNDGCWRREARGDGGGGAPAVGAAANRGMVMRRWHAAAMVSKRATDRQRERIVEKRIQSGGGGVEKKTRTELRETAATVLRDESEAGAVGVGGDVAPVRETSSGRMETEVLVGLIYDGKLLADDKTAREYNIEGGSVLHLVMALRGGNI
ncbi:hypothetical protein Scep_017756 [Stephania cephalantha]|uniref:Ubiquitin-like domain-containing protein n=1 Tax=Stephania cephalantha TaxID=152367 RepID=A0AAP0NUI9_9MAGN